ncbi:Clp protease [Mesomycoplasma hyorhinis]|uniref:Clp protease n=1 Tax=Mesomycoplasma hyorhinis TaxID=2100 RepID=UPI00136B8E2A|nr:Clp protease [Mesomycoplasma hyorhinis]MXR11262.1 Clp protease [Mesomycoplasma hyorhinis]MXR38741.1 Clp protease [Mesomycoplasma hyorhinis]
MSFYKAFESIFVKSAQKNILLLSENIFDYIFISDIKNFFKKEEVLRDLNEVPTSFFIDLPKFLSLVFRELNYKTIKYFSPSTGITNLNRNLEELINNKEENEPVEEQGYENEDDLLSEELENPGNEIPPIAVFINSIIEEINAYKNDLVNEKEKKRVYIIDWGDLLTQNGDQSVTSSVLAGLIKTFIDNLEHNVAGVKKSNFKLIFICKNKDNLNNVIYNKNPEINFISIAKPDSEERKKIFEIILKDEFNKNLTEPIKVKTSQFDEVISLTNDLSFREIIQLLKVSQISKFENFKSLYTTIFFNKKQSEWEKISPSQLENFETTISKRVKG